MAKAGQHFENLVFIIVVLHCYTLTKIVAAPVDGDEHYDPAAQMVTQSWHGPGYHTKIRDGTLVHGTTNSMNYALSLLSTSDPARHERASAIIRKVLTLQDTNPVSKNYGTWPWMLEEPLDQMAVPDQNWTAFIGALLVTALIDDSPKFPSETTRAIRVSLGHVSKAIVRRNIGSGYTNIAALSSAVACASGEALGDQTTLDWGRSKLRDFLNYTREHGGFTEYNSPNYTMVVMHEMERLLHLVKDPQARHDAEAVRKLVWECVAQHFHPGTGQWAGPHSRLYQDLLDAGTAEYLANATGIAIGNRKPGPPQEPWYLPCPPDFVPRFRKLPADPLVVDSMFFHGKDEATTLHGTTWLTGDGCLGSINRDSLWTQRRPLIAYWRVGDGKTPAVLRLRFLKDGRDFASAAVISTQSGPRVLSTIRLIAGSGDWHISMDRPPKGQFSAADLRVRYELSAIGATACALAPGTFELTAGKWHAVIHVAPESRGEGGQFMQWETGSDSKSAWIDGIYRHGDNANLDLSKTRPPFAAVGLELLNRNAQPTPSTVTLAHDGGQARWNADGAMVTAIP